MAQLDVKLNDGKGWTFIKESSIQSLKTAAKKLNDKTATYRIIDNGICCLVGTTLQSGRMDWGKAQAKPREELHLGTDSKPKTCQCGSKPNPVTYDEETHHYIITCQSETCSTKAASAYSAQVVKLWNKHN